MGDIVKAKLFTHGGSQAVRLPKAFRFEGSEVRISREGDRVVLEPVERDWEAFFHWLDSRKSGRPEDDWQDISDPAPEGAVEELTW